MKHVYITLVIDWSVRDVVNYTPEIIGKGSIGLINVRPVLIVWLNFIQNMWIVLHKMKLLELFSGTKSVGKVAEQNNSWSNIIRL